MLILLPVTTPLSVISCRCLVNTNTHAPRKLSVHSQLSVVQFTLSYQLFSSLSVISRSVHSQLSVVLTVTDALQKLSVHPQLSIVLTVTDALQTSSVSGKSSVTDGGCRVITRALMDNLSDDRFLSLSSARRLCRRIATLRYYTLLISNNGTIIELTHCLSVFMVLTESRRYPIFVSDNCTNIKRIYYLAVNENSTIFKQFQ